jgi:hypothetical protein
MDIIRVRTPSMRISAQNAVCTSSLENSGYHPGAEASEAVHCKRDLRSVRSRHIDKRGVVFNMYSVEGHKSIPELHGMGGGRERILSRAKRQRYEG